MSLRNGIINIRESGMTLTSWCKRNGFHYSTVVGVLHGVTGKRRIGITLDIINALKRDGYLSDEDIAA